ncbi:PHD finger ING2 [Micractinium conductrix]|uniref:PHD finger ING2 n=1 Tax=Micractinium conductrix TaxID=554055 RepID=A0A2P6VN09_9CHLO|nr:PHD finger ING2 [Micractinium conductrix]|eukprot:PSC75473.1 PHD finger ING2 [Micractinium conductrix]
MGDQIIYLEKYIDSTTSLPAELNRILNSIKDLDERSDDLAAQIQENVEAVLRMAPAGGGGGSRGKAGGDAPRELKELRDQIDRDQQLLIQFAEEKVQLAVQGYDLLEQHLGQADLDIVHLEAELHAMGMGDQLTGMSMGPDYSGGTFEDTVPTRQRAGSRMRDVPSFDSIEQAAAAAAADPKPRKTTITLNLSRQISGLEAAGGGNAQTPGTESLGVARAQQRPGSAPPRKAVTPAPLPVAPATEGYQRNRRAAAAGVHAVAAEVAAMEEDEEEQAAAAARHRGGGMPGGGAIPAHLQGHMPSAEVAQMFQGQGHY